ncbi:MAG: hypothetical protein AAF703_07690 [Cyanobacteria bacterium P01_D01_bin.105]
MEPILILSNLVLIGLTGTYAWLTNKSTKQLKQDSLYYRHIIEKQLKFSALPHLYWDLRPIEPQSQQTVAMPSPDADLSYPGLSSSGEAFNQEAFNQEAFKQHPEIAPQNGVSQGKTLALEVFNISNVPAYDVHVSLIGAYTEERLGIATFMRTHVQPRHRKYPLQSDKVGYYGVRNAMRLSLLPTQQKIVLSLPFPIQPVDVYTLVQYRELSGQNYYQVCCFSAIDESGAYRANILEPSNIQSMTRLHLFDIEDFTLPETLGLETTGTEAVDDEVARGKEDLPYYLADFIDLWNHSISSRLMLKAPAVTIEDAPAKTTYDF